MKKIIYLTSLIGFATLVGGCSPAADTPKAKDNTATAQQLDKAVAATKDASKDMEEFAFSQRAQFVASMRVRLVELDRDFDDLAVKIAKSSGSIKTEGEQKLAALRVQASVLSKQVEAVTDSNESSWNGVKADAKKAYAAMKDSFTQARQWASEKIAP